MAVTPGILSYDIADNRRRTRLRRLLEAYGQPLQESVFALHLPASRWAELERQARALVDRVEDDVRLWPLCAACQRRAAVWCGPEHTAPGTAIFL